MSKRLQVMLDAIRHAAAHAFPTADIDRMLAEIEAGYRQPPAVSERRRGSRVER